MHSFRAAVEAGDISGLMDLFADDVVFHSPIVFAPYRGRDDLAMLLGAVARVLEDLRYEREIGSPDGSDHALVFRARIGEREVHGCDFLHTNPRGLIDEFVVMVRPLTAALALAEAMKGQLARAQPEPGIEAPA